MLEFFTVTFSCFLLWMDELKKDIGLICSVVDSRETFAAESPQPETSIPMIPMQMGIRLAFVAIELEFLCYVSGGYTRQTNGPWCISTERHMRIHTVATFQFVKQTGLLARAVVRAVSC